ncbi:TetR/AcrR family transcriptional regulator [Phaeobacter sp. QD34_3]|uniref:TetR/AcrR family transcriptional regulator n=1 Tax=unclassified Phaeobacter TaxID=2621772 RepID=UPI00237F3CAC|nr:MULTISPECIES: TetR/AcrR family transcriptional regulator [unclassified Phaeobacter]MDE4134884.1 TetR/AcrR family transcriptional regulator [Phaeobacter sp. QD34_3]MDE4138520.1 TetR/AcrR family transcriptional regulator [Phaeobacter sp. QD34_24]
MSMNHDKDAALNNAMRQFWAHGFASTSLKDLERVTGMHPGSLYAAFGSKAKLFALSMQRYSDWLNAERARVMEQASSHLDGLAAFIEQVHPLSNAQAPIRTCFMVKTALELGAEDSEIRSQMIKLLEANDRVFEAAFQSAIEAGELPKGADPAKLTRHLNSGLAGICFCAMRAEASETIAELVSELAAKVRSGAI